jgi:hypothetical protein
MRILAPPDMLCAQDADGELTLDLYEVSPFYHYAFAKLFGVSLHKDQTEALFHLMDMDGDTEVTPSSVSLFCSPHNFLLLLYFFFSPSWGSLNSSREWIRGVCQTM